MWAILKFLLKGVALSLIFGALAQLYFKRRDKKKLQAVWDHLSQNGECFFVRTRQGHSIAVRILKPTCSSSSSADGIYQNLSSPKNFRVIIPNGLGATMMTLGQLQERLAQLGFTVVTFDRPGVGFSPPLSKTAVATTGTTSSNTNCAEYNVGWVQQTVDEIEDVIAACFPPSPHQHTQNDQQFLLVGPSMGSVVCQAFMAAYPHRVAGFISVDGLPHPFYKNRQKFLKVSKVYTMVSYIIWTGVVRLGLSFNQGLLQKLSSSAFNVDAVAAEMNQAQFFGNLAEEFKLMMDLCHDSAMHWGPLDVAKLSKNEVDLLVRIMPKHNGTFDASTGEYVEQERGSSERGEDWIKPEQTETIQQILLNKVSTNADNDHDDRGSIAQISPLYAIFHNIPVGVLSARSYDYPGGSWYSDDLRDWAAAEHSMHVLVAKSGSFRIVMPKFGHNRLFLEVDAIAQAVEQIDVLATSSK